MRKCRIGKKLGNYYHNYGDMFEKMSVLDIAAWAVGTAALSAAIGWAAGKIAEYTAEVVTKDPVTQYKTEKGDVKKKESHMGFFFFTSPVIFISIMIYNTPVSNKSERRYLYV